MILIALLIFCCCISASDALVLDASQYPNLQAAINAAQSGDIISIPPAIYNGTGNCNLVIAAQNSNISLVGSNGSQNTIIDCSGSASRCLTVSDARVSIQGLQFRNGQAGGVTTTATTIRRATTTDHIRSNILPQRRRNSRYLAVFSMQMFVGTNGMLFAKTTRKKRTSTHSRTKPTNNPNIINDSFGGCVLVQRSPFLALNDVLVSGGRAINGSGLAVLQSSVQIQNCSFINNGVDVYPWNALPIASGSGAYFADSSISMTAVTFAANYIRFHNTSDPIRSGGAGFAISNSPNLQITGPLLAQDNYIVVDTSPGSTALAGVGGFITFTNNSVIVGPISFIGNVLNVTVAAGTSDIGGGGLFITNVDSFMLRGPILLQYNGLRISDLVNSVVVGAGICISFATNFRLFGPTTVSNNWISSDIVQQDGVLSGAGFFIRWSNVTNVSGKLVVTDNSMTCGMVLNSVVFGAGILFSSVTLFSDANCDAVITGNYIASHISGQGAEVFGGGVNFALSNITLYGNFVISGNILNTTASNAGGVFAAGAGLYSVGSPMVNLLGTIRISNNTIVARIVYDSYGPGANASRLLPPLIYTGFVADCNSRDFNSNGHVVATNLRSTNCLLELSPKSSMDTLLGVYQLQLWSLNFYLNPTCSVNFISFFDGPSTASPLIGTYCGTTATNTTLQDLVCSSGRCPPIDRIESTVGSVTVLFQNNFGLPYDFELTWNMVPRNLNQTFSASNFTIGILGIPAAIGAGVGAEGSTIRMQNAEVADNTIVCDLLAMGGGIAVISGQGLHLENSVVRNNAVFGAIAAGGGISTTAVSTTNLKNVTVANNIATGSGICFWTSAGNAIQCPSSLGGGLISAHDASIIAVASIFRNNTVDCSSVVERPCIARGGDVGVVDNGTVIMHQTDMVDSVSRCFKSRGCFIGLGGALYGDVGTVRIDGGPLIANNLIDGIGVGGAFCILGFLRLELANVSIEDCSAQEGGAIWMENSAYLLMQGSYISRCSATIAGGGIAATGNVMMNVEDTIMANNSAVHAATMTVFLSITGSVLRISGGKIVGPAVSQAMILGKANIQTHWECTVNGSIYQMLDEEDRGYYSFGFLNCSEGSYSVGRADSESAFKTQCHACPYGAICTGTNTTSSGLWSLAGFWGQGDYETGTAEFHQCPEGYCCQERMCEYNFCVGNRRGVLCGSCEEDYSMSLLASNCYPNEQCTEMTWFIPVGILMSIVLIVVLLCRVHRESDGTWGVLVFFYQAAPLAASLSNKSLSLSVISVIESAFNIAPRGKQFDVCVLPNLSMQEVLFMKMAMYLVLFLAVPLTWGLHRMAYWFVSKKRKRFFPTEFVPPDIGDYCAVTVQIFTIAYTSLAVNSMHMLECIEFAKEERWFFNGDVVCWKEPWQYGALVLSILLGLVPFAVAVILLRWQQREKTGELSHIESKISKVLVSPFVPERKWWSAISLLRRLAISAAFAFTSANDGWRLASMFLLTSIFLGIQLWGAPYKSNLVQREDGFVILIMCVMTGLSAPRLSLQQLGLDDDSSLDSVQIFLFLVPGIVLGGMMLYEGYKMVRAWYLRRKKVGKERSAGWQQEPLLESSSISIKRDSLIN